MPVAISIKDLLIRQGNNFLLSISSLELQSGRIYALTGPNGAGKTTLLRAMALLSKPLQGQVRVAGQAPGNLTRARQMVTLVEQSPYLLKGSVYDNLAFGLKLRDIRGEEQRSRIKSALEMVGLADFAQRRANRLSAGEGQRLALARALALKPRVLLLDEPTSNIDNESLPAFEALLSRLPESGMTVIFSTHDRLQPERLGGISLRLENGRLQTPVEVADNQEFHLNNVY